MKLLKAIGITLALWSSALGQVPEKVHEFAKGIAQIEGFYQKGSVASRYHNPGDIRTFKQHAYRGQVRATPHGYAVFQTDAQGWAALERNLTRIANNTSRYYRRDMTIKQIARLYAEDPKWVDHLCNALGISPDITFEQYLIS